MQMLDLNIIINDEKQAIHCRTLEEAQQLLDAVRKQRTDINTYSWESTLVNKKYEDKAFMLSYCGCKSLKFGSVPNLRSQGIEIIPFEMLSRYFDLPEVEANQTGILSLLGVEA